VVCNPSHLPHCLTLPLEGNSLQSQRFQQQAVMKEPFRKQVWRQLIQSKLKMQGLVLELLGREHAALTNLASRVKSGDPENLEAQGARVYWRELFGGEFRRDRYGPMPNALLNYGYTVLRAAMARAICASGLHPTLGVHHHRRDNPFCLADDLMEPFRPLVDQAAFVLWESGILEINQPAKRGLLDLFNQYTQVEGRYEMIQSAILLTAQSLTNSLQEGRARLTVPESVAHEAA
jgi:CRISPR-associated protein Cas1